MMGCRSTDLPMPPDAMRWFTPIPQSLARDWKASLKAAKRQQQDRQSGDFELFAAPEKGPHSADWIAQIRISQELKPNAYADNKWHNLAIAMRSIEPVIIQPGQILSFSHLVGNPSEMRGYRVGRTLINGQLQAVAGGGLCQLSGLIYLLALHTDFDIIERHPHSQDIYTDETRFTPLGSDAAVVYGYKDLRIKNQTTTPVRFQFDLYRNQITGTIVAMNNIPKYDIEFLIEESNEANIVRTMQYKIDRASPECVETSVYGHHSARPDRPTKAAATIVSGSSPDNPSPTY
jgi:vancomycin resistance protein VanW